MLAPWDRENPPTRSKTARFPLLTLMLMELNLYSEGAEYSVELAKFNSKSITNIRYFNASLAFRGSHFISYHYACLRKSLCNNP